MTAYHNQIHTMFLSCPEISNIVFLVGDTTFVARVFGYIMRIQSALEGPDVITGSIRRGVYRVCAGSAQCECAQILCLASLRLAIIWLSGFC